MANPNICEWLCKSENEMDQIAKAINGMLPDQAIICLHGNLGAGKTSLTRALLRDKFNDPKLTVPSPTYGFVQTYGDQEDVWHFDLYRLPDPQDIYDLGWEDALTAQLCIIEWPSMAGNLIPKNTCNIHIEVLQDGARAIKMHL
jgi:tRNA threonylcarbamoyl adenosine modification protein YjeE